MKKTSFKMIGASILAATLLASCTTAAPAETEPAIPSSSVVESSVSETTTESSEEETEYTGLSVETEPHENPLGSFITDTEYYNAMAFNLLINDVSYLPDANYGFDNPRSIYLLQQEVYEATGVMDNSITLSDVGYFQFNPHMEYSFDEKTKFSENDGFEYQFRIEGVRAILSSLGLRFGIDEIPASYLMQRFPRLYYDELYYNNCKKFYDTTSVNTTNIYITTSLNDITDLNQRDVLLFKACIIYNNARLYCVYNNPYGTGCITQERDAATGKNVLVPTDSEAEAMQEDINLIPGCENISIYTPETPEEFFDSYGYYPDDLLNNVGSVNTPEAFEEYINSLPESDKDYVLIDAIEECFSN